VDAGAEGLDAEAAARRIAERRPLLVAVVVYGHQPSASTQVMPGASALCAALKDHAPEAKVLLAGGHVAALPERTLRDEAADFVANGEGLYTLVDLLQALKARATAMTGVRDLWYREGDAVCFTSPAPLLQGLDEALPGVAWDLLPMTKYRAHNWHCFGGLPREPYAALYTTLGCPYHCGFCCIHAPFKSGERALGWRESANSYRFWSPAAVVRQIDTLVQEHGVRNLKIADEMFVLNERHVATLCDLLIERRYDLNVWAYARVDTVKDALMDKLKQAGFNWLAFGIEAAGERVRSGMRKGFDQDRAIETLAKVQGAGINVIANFIFGLPDDDLDSMQATLDMALDLNCEFANFYCAMAYPGSELYGLAVTNNWPLPKQWSGYSQHARDTLPLPTKYVSAAEVLRFRDAAFQTYFTNPRYLNRIAEKFGQGTVDHIRQMTTHQLKRELLLPGSQPGSKTAPGRTANESQAANDS